MMYLIAILLCLSVGWFAQIRGRSFWGFAVLAIFLSPLLTFILLLCFKKYPKTVPAEAHNTSE